MRARGADRRTPASPVAHVRSTSPAPPSTPAHPARPRSFVPIDNLLRTRLRGTGGIIIPTSLMGQVAEFEASAISQECLGKIRVGSIEALTERVSHWRERADAKRKPIHWSFTMDDARAIFGVERLNKLLTEH